MSIDPHCTLTLDMMSWAFHSYFASYVGTALVVTAVPTLHCAHSMSTMRIGDGIHYSLGGTWEDR